MMMKLFYCGGAFLELFLGFVITRRLYPEFRFENRAVRAAGMTCYVLYMFLGTWNMWDNYISATAIPFLSGGFAFLYWIFRRSNFWEILLLQLFYSTSVSILKLPLLTLKGIVLQETVIQANRGHRELWEAVSVYLIVWLVFMAVKRYQTLETAIRRLLSENKLLCMLVIISEWMLLLRCMEAGHTGFVLSDFIFNTLIALCSVMTIIALTISVVYQQIKSEAVQQQVESELLKAGYYELKEQQERSSRWVHDAKHELLYIRSCLEENDVSGAYEALQGYLQEIGQMEKKVWSGFSFLDFIINYKKAEMDKKEIKFILDVELQQITVPEEDLAVMLGNLLDNAIEAAEKCEKDRRYIKVKLCNLNDMLLLGIANSSSEAPQLKNGVFLSNKKDRGAHGLGLQSVKRLVADYDGEIHFEYSEKDFQVKILI